MPIHGLVISDLHLLARRSVGEALLDSIQSQMDRCEVLVLNGDTFDFRWSTLPSENDSVAAAIRWIEHRMARMDGRDLHFILGNHDCIHRFSESMDAIQQKWPNFHIHESTLQLGDQLFLHGDCANRKMTEAELRKTRQGWAADRPRGSFQASLYGLVDRTGLSLAFHRCYFPQGVVVKRIAHHLDDALPQWREKTSDCYFGHTHMPFRDHKHDEILFHNTGSAIRGMGFQPIEFHYNKTEEHSR